jgi:hypothetical protein
MPPSQYSAVTGKPYGGIDYESLIRAKAKLLPQLYAQQDLDAQRAAELEFSKENADRNYNLAQTNLDTQKDLQEQAMESAKVNSIIGTGLGAGSLGVTGWKAWKDAQLSDKLSTMLNGPVGAEPQIYATGGEEALNITGMNPDAALERMGSGVPSSELVTNVPATETLPVDVLSNDTINEVSSALSGKEAGGLENLQSLLDTGRGVDTAASAVAAGEYGAQGGIGTGIGELAALGGELATGAGYLGAVYGASELLNKLIIPSIGNAIFGEGTHVWEEPTEKLLREYTLWHRDKAGEFKGLDPDAYSNLGMSGWGGNPVAYQELLRRGVANLPEPDPNWQDWNVWHNLNDGGGWA